LNRYNAWAAIRKRAKAAGFLTPVGCPTWRATGITIYLENDGRLEHAQQMAGHDRIFTVREVQIRDLGREQCDKGSG
jgi:integrase